jgi:hypothetical protein
VADDRQLGTNGEDVASGGTMRRIDGRGLQAVSAKRNAHWAFVRARRGVLEVSRLI